jgi:dihydroorotate dehydrogenase (fumarate)
MLMSGADVTMLCSALMRHGIERIGAIEHEMTSWMEDHEYESVEQLKGSLSQKNCPDPNAFERAQYMRAVGVQTPGITESTRQERGKRGLRK